MLIDGAERTVRLLLRHMGDTETVLDVWDGVPDSSARSYSGTGESPRTVSSQRSNPVDGCSDDPKQFLAMKAVPQMAPSANEDCVMLGSVENGARERFTWRGGSMGMSMQTFGRSIA